MLCLAFLPHFASAAASKPPGTQTLGDILNPAIQLAEQGFPVGPVTAFEWGKGAPLIVQQGGAGESAVGAAVYVRPCMLYLCKADGLSLPFNPPLRPSVSTPNTRNIVCQLSSPLCDNAGMRALVDEQGCGPKAGQLWRNPDLAATYRRVGELGAAKGDSVCLMVGRVKIGLGKACTCMGRCSWGMQECGRAGSRTRCGGCSCSGEFESCGN